MQSSRSFYEGQWSAVKEELSAGDIVILQFGTCDSMAIEPTPANRIGGSLPGTGDETRTVRAANGENTTVHTYGWYLEKMASEAKEKGATPIICSPVPRNAWNNGKVARAGDFPAWAREAAQKANVAFSDLSDLLCTAY